MPLRAQDVFVPGSFPEYTYVQRSSKNYEQTLRDALSTPGQVISLSGPSKSGKTVLVEKVVGRDYLISVSGASIRRPEEIWDRVMDWIGIPNSVTDGNTTSAAAAIEARGSGSVALPLVAKGELGGSVRAEFDKGSSSERVHERSGLPQIAKEIAKSDFVILVDDFHYMDRELQSEVAKLLKEAVRLDIKIVTAAVAHRGDDVVRANPELRGRVYAIDLGYWPNEDLRRIAEVGFQSLSAVLDNETMTKFAEESAGSPQLMQSICLQACFVAGLREKAQGQDPRQIEFEHTTTRATLEQTSASTDFRSLVDVLEAGRRVRGTERKTYKFHDRGEGDVYRVILKALAADPPRLSFKYDELLRRTAEICDGESPVGSSVTSTCVHMSAIARETFPRERAIDWDDTKQVFDIPDPYLLFYLRWSGRLSEAA